MKKVVTKREEMRARAIVQCAQDQAHERDIAQKRELIGRCFKYLNSYSSVESWWLYAIVTGVDEHGRLSAVQMQHDSRDSISIEPEAYPGLLPVGGWSEISQDEFRAAAVQIAAAFLQRTGVATTAATKKG